MVQTLAAHVGAEPTVVAAHAVERDPGVDAACTVDLTFGTATARSRNSMLDDHYHFSIHVTGSRGEALVHNFIKPHEDDRLTVRTRAEARAERLGTRTSYSYQLEAFAAAIRGGAPLPIDAADAVENMVFIDAAYRAAGLPVR